MSADPIPVEPTQAPALNLDAFNRTLIESVGVGIAIVECDGLKVLFQNKQFEKLFGTPANDITLDQLIDAPDLSALEPGGVVTCEITVKHKRRPVTLAAHFSLHHDNGRDVLMVEMHNITKVKELEYMIESYAKMVEKNERALRREKERAERLLLNIMPRSVFEELKTFGVTTPQRYDSASVLMLDFVDFTEMAISKDPLALISELNDIFTGFDRIVEQFGCERLKTIGDAYVAVSGIPEAAPDHAQNIARAALLFRRFIRQRNATREEKWRCRIGIASGPMIGSIVGIQKYVYDIFGPAMDLAARMEQHAEPMEILLPEVTADLIHDEFRLEQLPARDIKGFGTLELFKLVGGDEELTASIF